MSKLKDIVERNRALLNKYIKIVEDIDNLSKDYRELNDSELKDKTTEFKRRLKSGETLDNILVEAFAVSREATYRKLGMFPYKVQLLGGIILHYGNISEMKTGEGKTLTAIMPTYLNALTEKGVHIVTVNDYLSKRDKEELEEVYKFLGLSVGLNSNKLSKEEKKVEYGKDILYSTNSELGFDYLKDNMVENIEDKVQSKGLNYAIIDEVDSILIDEARTPLIISSKKQEDKSFYKLTDRFAKSLVEGDYEKDDETKVITLTESGIAKAEMTFHLDNIYTESNKNLVHCMNNSLQANYSMEKDKDYVVKDKEVLIVDSFTGRTMEGRRYNDGLHQALESKERVPIQDETMTSATITYQNYFRLYKKLSGMTGTAITERDEFREIYNMLVIPVPTNKPIARKDKLDKVFHTNEDKYKALIEDIKCKHGKGQPILIGTATIEKTDELSKLLSDNNINHVVLNAKNHFKEAEIILNAGQKGSVTIATNMAGRGTDIKLGKGVEDLGGLAVIGTERHESRRIDNQLRGRSGRQGDVGESQFYLSLEDDLLKRYGNESVKSILKLMNTNTVIKDKNKIPEPIKGKLINKQILSAQMRVEGNNYDSRKTTLQYDDIKNVQRTIVYEQRDKILLGNYNYKKQLDIAVQELVDYIIPSDTSLEVIDNKKIIEYLKENVLMKDDLENKEESLINLEMSLSKGLENKGLIGAKDVLLKYILNEIMGRESIIEDALHDKNLVNFHKKVMLSVIDTLWIEHIDRLEKLESAVKLRSYAQTDPLVAFQEDSYRLYQDFLKGINFLYIQTILRARIDNIKSIGK